MPMRLVLLRHGQSTWNQENLFTGWHDVPLTELGEQEARDGGRQLRDAGIRFDKAHSSLLLRAVQTLNLALAELGQLWLPVERSWRLNERHYGELQGKNKAQTTAEFGADQVKLWRRSYDVPPPRLTPEHPEHPSHDPRYARLAPDLLPASESLAEVVARVLPYWYDAVVPDLRAGLTVLVAAHGNSLRALLKHLERVSDADIAEVNIPTGMPRLYELGEDLRPVEEPRYLDPLAAKEAAEAVARQADAPAAAGRTAADEAEPDDTAER